MQWQTNTTISWMMTNILKNKELGNNSQYWITSVQQGKIGTSSMYKDLRGDSILVRWKTIFFKNHARPMARFNIWLVLHGILPTKDRLQKFGVVTDGKCTFCQQDETLDHLFFYCMYTMDIRAKVLRWIGYIKNVSTWVLYPSFYP